MSNTSYYLGKTFVFLAVSISATLAACGGGESGDDLYTVQSQSDAHSYGINDGALAQINSLRHNNGSTRSLDSGQQKPGVASGGASANKEDNVAGFIIKYKTDLENTALGTIAEGSSTVSPLFNNLNTVLSKHGMNVKTGTRMFNGARSLRLQNLISDAQAATIVSELKSIDPNIALIEPDTILRAAYVPNDPFFATEQWHYQAGIGGINLSTAWQTASTRGQGVNVAVIDSGYTDHPDLLPNIVQGYDFISDPQRANDGGGRDSDARDPGDWSSLCDVSSTWHGTHVAGTIAAVTNNSIGVAGVAFNAKVVPIRVLGRCGGFLSDVADAIAWASGAPVPGIPNNANIAKVINLSLGGEESCGPTMQAAIDQAIARGATVVVAAGNAGIDVRNYTPANCRGVIAVAASTKTDLDASYSNFGDGVTIAAPGGENDASYGCNPLGCSPGRGPSAVDGIFSTFNLGSTVPGNHDYAGVSGTSMAAPHVSGVAALLIALRPNITNADVELILKQTARPFAAGCNPLYCSGAGIIDAAAALALDPASITKKPVYRFFHGPSQSYFLTISAFERNNIMLNYPSFFYEGPQFSALVSANTTSSSVYRFRNIQNGSYFWTISTAERNSISKNFRHQFVEEDIGWHANQTSTNGWVPLYRFRDVNNTYLFTASNVEAQSLLSFYANRFIPEGVAYYVQP